MDDQVDVLLVSAAKQMKGFERRKFLARCCLALCDENPRKTETRFGWGRETVAKGLRELKRNKPEPSPFEGKPRGRLPSEQKNPQLAIDIRLIVEPHTHSDPELKTSRKYTNLSAAEVRKALIAKGYDPSEVPSERTLRDILNRMNYRLKRIQKGRPLKKTRDTNAIFENVHAARDRYRDDPKTLEISVDTKAKVKLGAYALGGKNADGRSGQGRQRLGS